MATTYATKTLGTPTLATKNTLSIWFKRSKLSTSQALLFGSSNGGGINIHHTDSIIFYNSSGSLRTNRLFRDTSAWYHIVVTTNTTLGTADDRLKMYINGVQETSFQSRSNPSQDVASSLGSATAHDIGRNNSPANYFDGSMSHVNFIDGTAYDASYFGETDATTGEWKIKTSPSVTYGTNGFFILKDGNSVTDQSGEGNDFTVGAGALTKTEDSPSNVFCTLNTLAQTKSDSLFKYANNQVKITADVGQRNFISTLAMSSGKFYFEAKLDNIGTNYSGSAPYIGIFAYPNYVGSQYVGDTGGAGYNTGGSIYSNGGSATNAGASYTTGDKIGCAVDLDNNKIYWHKDGTYVSNGTGTGNPSTGANGYDISAITALGDVAFCLSGFNINAEWACNFGNGYFGDTIISSAGTNASGNGIFEYDVPTGFTALSTKGLNL